MFRKLTLVAAALALTCFVAAPVLAEEKSDAHVGTFVKAEDNKLYMKGADGKEHVHGMIKDTPITYNGESCKAADLTAGVKIKVTFGSDKKVTKIEAIDAHEGTYVKAEDNKLYMKGTDGKEHVHGMIKDTPITYNGKSCKAADLKAGSTIRVYLGQDRKVTKIEASDIHEGTFVKAEDNKLYMKGADGKEYVHDMIKDTPITCNGKSCKAADLTAGFKIEVYLGTDKKVTKIDAFSK
jgi:ribosomal 50S subunit-recycling heat shock protein